MLKIWSIRKNWKVILVLKWHCLIKFGIYIFCDLQNLRNYVQILQCWNVKSIVNCVISNYMLHIFAPALTICSHIAENALASFLTPILLMSLMCTDLFWIVMWMHIFLKIYLLFRLKRLDVSWIKKQEVLGFLPFLRFYIRDIMN